MHQEEDTLMLFVIIKSEFPLNSDPRGLQYYIKLHVHTRVITNYEQLCFSV